MSGRLAQFSPPHSDLPADWKPNWNLAPGKPLLILRKQAGQIECVKALWNLTPSWLTDLSRASFSARAEYLHEKPMFRQAFAQRRCLIPVDGYFLWLQQGARKQPWYLLIGPQGAGKSSLLTQPDLQLLCSTAEAPHGSAGISPAEWHCRPDAQVGSQEAQDCKFCCGS